MSKFSDERIQKWFNNYFNQNKWDYSDLKSELEFLAAGQNEPVVNKCANALGAEFGDKLYVEIDATLQRLSKDKWLELDYSDGSRAIPKFSQRRFERRNSMIRRLGRHTFEASKRNEMARFADGKNRSIESLLTTRICDVSEEVDKVRDVLTLLSDQPLRDAIDDVDYSLRQLAEFLEGYGCVDINKRNLCGFDKVDASVKATRKGEVCYVRLESIIGDTSFSWRDWQRQEDLTDVFGYYEYKLPDGKNASINIELIPTSRETVKLVLEVEVWTR